MALKVAWAKNSMKADEESSVQSHPPVRQPENDCWILHPVIVFHTIDSRNSLLSHVTTSMVRHQSGCEDNLGGSVYDHAYLSSLFEDNNKDEACFSVENQNHDVESMGTSNAGNSDARLFMSKNF